MRGGHREKTVTTVRIDRASAGRGQGIVRPWEGDTVHHHQRQRRPGHVHALPQGQGAEQTGTLVLCEPTDQPAGGVVPLTQDRLVEAFTEFFGGLLGRPHRREQAQRPTVGGLDQFEDLVQTGG